MTGSRSQFLKKLNSPGESGFLWVKLHMQEAVKFVGFFIHTYLSSFPTYGVYFESYIFDVVTF